ncbi:hypothetical protein [Brachybacterium paraconglomeratum]|uniref:hypothetical protein n=1 Tax=Brachybacterium paraconglomeratum TaxID=173362 RepID=UPI003F7C4D29
MTEYKFVNFRQAASTFVPRSNGDVTALALDLAGSVPAVAEHMDGWEAVGFQITPVENDVLITFFLRTKVDVDELLPGEK